MIPLRDDVGRRGVTPATWALVGIWVTAYVVLWRLDSGDVARLEAAIGLEPREWWRACDVLRGRAAGGRAEALVDFFVPLIGYKLLHGGVVHVAANALFFPLFAGRLEARAGTVRFLLFHEAAGVLVALAQLWWASSVPTTAIGASGAVAASIVAYLLLYARSRVHVLVPVVVVPIVLELPAFVLALVWAVLQVRPVSRLLEIGPATPVAWQGIVAGAAGGAALLPVVLWRRARSGRRRA